MIFMFVTGAVLILLMYGGWKLITTVNQAKKESASMVKDSSRTRHKAENLERKMMVERPRTFLLATRIIALPGEGEPFAKNVNNSSAPSKAIPVSMSPENFRVGYLDDMDVEITDVAATMFDYIGLADPIPTLAVEFTDEQGREYTEHMSVGRSEDWEPSKEGRGFVSTTRAIKLMEDTGRSWGIDGKCVLARFIKSLVAAGVDGRRFDDGNLKRGLIGMQMHVKRMAREEIN
jgi:hypothetical protein